MAPPAGLWGPRAEQFVNVLNADMMSDVRDNHDALITSHPL